MSADAAHDDPDAEVLARIVRGDQAAFAVLVDRHLPAIHRLAQRLLGSPAEADDVSQDALLRAWEHAPSWRSGKARYSTWLYQVALNLCRDRLRARRPASDLVDALVDHSPQPDQHLADAQREQRLAEALGELPERQREALTLFHYQGLSQQEAAHVMEVTEDALESLLARARRALRQRLAPASKHQATGN
jgi:RNA polymerase sigma-70 factor, ECF subfamily